MSIVRIRKPKSGWEIIPNEFINDLRLSVDAVAVGLWLACKPESWQVRPLAIQTEFSRRPGKPRGEEWWTRVSKELRGAGYLRLVNTRNTGRFTTTWEFCVFGLESDKVTDPGSAGVGSAAPGQPPHSNQHEKQPILKLKTPPLLAPIGAAGSAPATAGGGGIFDSLIIEPSINQFLPQLLDILRRAGIEAPAHAQDLLDELAGTIDAVKRGEREKKIDNPILWMKKVAAGDFIRNRCFEVQARRQASKASQKPALKAVLAFNPLAQAKGEEVLASVRRRLQSKQIPHRDQI